MAQNLFDNAKFGDMFLTTENKQAVFLRFTENAEYEFAILYVEGWGNVQVFRHNGKEVHDDVAYSIIGKQKDQMMKDAKSGIGTYDNYIKFKDGTWIDLDPSMSLKPSFTVKSGERVKVIVIKEE